MVRLQPVNGRSRVWVTGGCVLMVGFLCAVDFLTGTEIEIGLLYLLPISVGTWYAGKTSGIFVSLLCVAAWAIAHMRHRA